MLIDDFLKMHGISYKVERAGEAVRSEIGMPNHDATTKNAYISFRPGTDVKAGDVITNPSGDVYFVIETETEFFQKQPSQLKAFYRTELEQKASEMSSASVFNIQNAYGSVIGTHNQATINYNSAINELKERVAADTSPDKEELDQIVSLLEMVVNDRVPPSKGLFSKFSEVMERHSWLSGSVAGTILSWLMSKMP